jgi:glycosyltransferase involved in cell wall biosynthesis
MGLSGIFCSVIIPTIGRSSLARAVESVLTQDFPRAAVEVVVVNDSGNPLSPEEWQHSQQVRLISTQKRRQITARNTGAAIALGRYLLFLDDDDWLLPGALRYFFALAQEYPTAGCLFGSFELVDDSGNAIARYGLQTSGNVAVHLVSGTWMQVAAVLVRADVFFAAGGLSPLFKISEEIDLFNRIAMSRDFAGRNTVVAHIHRGYSWQTSVDYSDVYEPNRLSRDRVLSLPHAFDRLQQSAGASSFWHGRIVRLYLISLLWNWRRKRRFCTGASRGVFALRSLLAARSYLFSNQFWRAIRQDLPVMPPADLGE